MIMNVCIMSSWPCFDLCSTNDDVLEEMKRQYMLQQQEKESTKGLNPSTL